MSDIGPELPPHLLAKRKRKQEETNESANAADSGAKPTNINGEKRRKVAGPAMPPSNPDERPVIPPNPQTESDSDDDDDYGPALPSSRGDQEQAINGNGSTASSMTQPEPSVVEEKVRRDEWMMMPPKQDDLAARMDPTKQRARGFNTGKGAAVAGANGEDNSTWHETPEQKQKRLADEMMGVSKPSGVGPQRPPSKASDGGATARKVKEYAEKNRGPSLMDQHQQSKGKEAEDDDPSKRAFDREKDMSTGMRVGHTQRKEMLNKAANFSSKFSGGNYL